jgi:hypothetical protein
VWTLRRVAAVAGLVSSWAAMPISTACVKCHRPLRAKSSAAGKRILCPRCGWIVELPVAASASVGVRHTASRWSASSARRDSAELAELLDVPVIKRTKYRSAWRSRLFALPMFNGPLRRRLTIAALLTLGMSLIQYARNLPAKPQIVAQNAAEPMDAAHHLASVIPAQNAEGHRLIVEPLNPPQPRAVVPALEPMPPTADAPTVAAPNVPVPNVAVPKDQPLPGLGPPNRAVPNQAVPNEAVPNEVAPNVAVPNQPLPNPLVGPFGGPRIGRRNNARFGGRPPGLAMRAVPGMMPRGPQIGQPQVGMPGPGQLAGRVTTVRLGQYSKENPPAVNDIVILRSGGLFGNVKSVDLDQEECKIKEIDRSAFNMQGKVHETSKTLTVRFDEIIQHPRMFVGRFAKRTRRPPTKKPAAPAKETTTTEKSPAKPPDTDDD